MIRDDGMIKRRDLLKILPIIFITLYRSYNLLLSGMGRTLPIAELFLQNIFSGNPSRKETKVVMVLFGMMEIVVFNLLYGSLIYRDLYESSAYIFVRQKSRRRWFAGKSLELLAYSAVYNLLFIGITFGLCVWRSEQRLDAVAVKIVILTYILATLFTFWTTLLINLTAILAGAAMSFVINYVVLSLLSLFAVGFETISIVNKFPLLLKLNPVANVTINWKCDMESAALSVMYFVVLCVLTCMGGSMVIAHKDIV